MRRLIAPIVAALWVVSSGAQAEKCRPGGYDISIPGGYHHDKWVRSDRQGDIRFEYDGYTSVFYAPNHRLGDPSISTHLAHPYWVAHELRKYASWYTWNFFAVIKDVWFDQSAFDGLKIGEEVAKVALAGFFGCLGAIVSLLMRLAEFDKTRGKSKEFLLLSGGTQPLVGGVFAAVIAALIISEIVTVSGISHSPKLWLFVVVGFISGFSERFTRSMLSVAENRFAPGPSQHDRKVTNGSRRAVL